MTPKEKAEELCSRYFQLNYDWDGVTKNQWAKEGALIAVDEVLDETKDTIWIGNSEGTEIELIDNVYDEYWTEVKQEIEKL